MTNMPWVDIIVLNWNGLPDTLECLLSLEKIDYPSYRVVVVDNGSTDGSPGVIKRKFSEVSLIENGENLGFAGGNNVGMRQSIEYGTDYILLLNNDTEVGPYFLRYLVDTCESNPVIGIAGPIIYFYENSQRVWSAGGRLDWQGRSSMIGLDEIDTGQFGQNYCEVDFTSGCAILLKSDVLRRIGLLDERFFAYYEEIEWCVRARRTGFKIVMVPKAKIWHKIPLDKRDSSPLVHYYMTRNRLLFLKTTGASSVAWLNTLVLDYFRTLLSWTLRPKWHYKKVHRNMMIRAVADAFLGRWGMCNY